MQDDVDVTRTAAPGRPFGGLRPFRSGDLVAGRFRVVREIAEGGMGIVYEAIDEKLAERRALKCAKAGYASRLSPEARTSLRVTHPNVCRVFEIHSTDTALGPIDFLTMEYVDGGTLSKELRGRGALPEPEARAIALQICAGVAAAHAQNLLHRDLKSSNVLMTRDAQGRRRAVVTDFGLAQEPSAIEPAPALGGVAGTPAYLAPERWAGAPATVASDVFALGVVLHELVTGTRPDVSEAGASGLAPAVPARWRPIVARCLDPDPARRFTSVAEVGEGLSGKGRWTRIAAWTAAALVALALIAWPLLFPGPVAARLAILPIESGTPDPQTTALVRGSSSELSSRLTRLRPRPPQLVIIPVEETRGVSRDDVSEAKGRLGASHVLKATVTRQGDQLALRGAIVDTGTKLTFGERTGIYPANDPAAITSALSALVASTFHLPRQTTAETIAPAAYAAYAEGVAALQSGTASYAQAVAAFERSIAVDPQSVLPRARLAEACYDGWRATSDSQWLRRGREELAHAERLNGDSIVVRLAAGLLNLVPGSYERSVEEYQRATQLDPTSAEAWNGLARAREQAGQPAAAVAAFEKAIALQPDYYRPINDLGAFYRRLGNAAEAEKQWVRLIALVPNRLEGHANLGGLYGDVGRYDEAERELRRALELEPRSRPVLNNLGALYQYMQREEDAVQYFERARAVGPETNVLWLNLGDSYRRLGREADAAAAYRRARELTEPVLLAAPRDAQARAFIAYFALRLGDRPTAERELAQALSLAKDDRTVLRRAVICYEVMGDRDRALGVLQSAPPEVLRELSRQPDLAGLRSDPRFMALVPASGPS
jgi:serine/threonine protein kinase/tetratricopeptide (TPR) repeat protein